MLVVEVSDHKSSGSAPGAHHPPLPPPPPTRPAPRPRPAPRGPAPSGGADWLRLPSLLRAALGIGRRSHARHALSSGPRASLRAGRDGPGGEQGRAGDQSSGGVRHRPRPHSTRWRGLARTGFDQPASPRCASPRAHLTAPLRLRRFRTNRQKDSACCAPRDPRDAPSVYPAPTHTHHRHHQVTQTPAAPPSAPPN